MRIVTANTLGPFWATLLVTMSVLPTAVRGTEVSAELLDIAARIEYGFYTEDSRTIEAARAGIPQLGRPSLLSNYYAALGAYRLALLSWHGGERGAGAWLDECEEGTTAAEQLDRRFTEAGILKAACAVLAARADPLLAARQQRKAEKTLQQALEKDPENPRLALLLALAINARPGLEVEAAAHVRSELSRALEGFRQLGGKLGEPDWGEAETLAHLGEAHLSAGEHRRARDLIEEALIIAPDYRFAQRLMNEVLSRH